MNLSEAVKEIADRMEKEKSEFFDQLELAWVDGIIRELRLAVRMSEREEPRSVHPTEKLDFEKVNRLKERLQNKVRDAAKLEETAQQVLQGSTAICVGGSEDGTIVPVDPRMPSGAYTMLGGEVYQYREGKFHYHEEMTVKTRKVREDSIVLG